MSSTLRRPGAAITAVFAGFLSACAPAAPAGLTDADRTAIQAVGDEFAEQFAAGNLAGVAALYTEDGALLPPNHEAVTGRAAIEAFLATFPPVTQMHITYVTVEGAGDAAWARGTYHMVMSGPDGAMIEDTGKFIEIRRKVGDRWLLAYDIFNSDMPVPTP